MNLKNPILTLTSIVLVLFLFAPIVARSLQTYPDSQCKSASIEKTSSSPTKADSQMPFEEKEKEEGLDNSINQLALIYILTEYIAFTSETPHSYLRTQVSGFYGNTPLYIVKRSILI